MGEKETGKRVAPGSAVGKKLALVIAAFAVGVLAVAYVGLCAFASGAKLWPHTSVLGVDVSGLTYAQAEEKLTAELPLKWVGKTVELYEPQSGTRLELAAEGLMEPSDLAESLTHVNDRGNFLTNGGRYVAALFSRGNADFGPSLRYTEVGQKRMDDTLAELTRELGIDGNETTYEVTDEAILFEKGVTGTAVDADAVRTGVTAALIGTGPETVNISLVQAPPPSPTSRPFTGRCTPRPPTLIWTRTAGRSSPRSPGRTLTWRPPGPPWIRPPRGASAGSRSP